MVAKAKQQFMDESEAELRLSKQSEYVKRAGIFEYWYFSWLIRALRRNIAMITSV